MTDKEKTEHAKLVRERAQLKADVANLKMLIRKMWPTVDWCADEELRKDIKELAKDLGVQL